MHMVLTKNPYNLWMAKNRVFVLYRLSNRWQRTKICDNFSSWAELLQGVPESSVLEPLGTIKKLLRLTIDRNLNFDDHVFSLCKKLAENNQLCLEFQIT